MAMAGIGFDVCLWTSRQSTGAKGWSGWGDKCSWHLSWVLFGTPLTGIGVRDVWLVSFNVAVWLIVLGTGDWIGSVKGDPWVIPSSETHYPWRTLKEFPPLQALWLKTRVLGLHRTLCSAYKSRKCKRQHAWIAHLLPANFLYCWQTCVQTIADLRNFILRTNHGRAYGEYDVGAEPSELTLVLHYVKDAKQAQLAQHTWHLRPCAGSPTSTISWMIMTNSVSAESG